MFHNIFLQISLLDWDDNVYVAKYKSFYVASEESKYKLSISGYDNITSTLPDAFALGGQSNAEFTTFDDDNDFSQDSNCAQTFSGGMYFDFALCYKDLQTWRTHMPCLLLLTFDGFNDVKMTKVNICFMFS